MAAASRRSEFDAGGDIVLCMSQQSLSARASPHPEITPHLWGNDMPVYMKSMTLKVHRPRRYGIDKTFLICNNVFIGIVTGNVSILCRF